MDKKLSYFKIIGIGIILILIQSFFQRYEALKEIYSTYVGYLVPVIYALFITIFLDPVVTKIEEKTKLSRLKSVCLTFLLVVILVVSFIGLVLPELGKSFKELYSKFPMMQDKIGSTITQLSLIHI